MCYFVEETKGKREQRFQSLLSDRIEEVEEEEELCSHGQSSVGEKKRRLSLDQVKALEKNFEVENKLDPESKVRLAQEIGLRPRQVAIWFQNRRARWKTKQLERDYSALKARHDALKLDHDGLRRDKEALEANVSTEHWIVIDDELCMIAMITGGAGERAEGRVSSEVGSGC